MDLNLEGRSQEKLRVFVTDRSGSSPLLLLSAHIHASRLLQAAGVATSWKLCVASGLRDSCFQSGSLSVAVRVLPANEARAWPIDPSSCGLALAGTQGENGFLAIVDAGCVSRIAGTTPQKWATALGHVMAHEIGHLLLGQDSHSASGLMSAKWTEAEQKLLVRGELHFTPEDSAGLRSAMARRARM